MIERARHDYEQDQRWAYDVPPERIAELREPPFGARWGDDDACCPNCGCLMSGDRDIPNTRNEGCEDFDCPCHKEEA